MRVLSLGAEVSLLYSTQAQKGAVDFLGLKKVGAPESAQALKEIPEFRRWGWSE